MGALMVTPLIGVAQTALTDDGSLRLSGFGTVGLTHLSAPDGWGYRRDRTQSGQTQDTSFKPDSRLGVQLNYTPTPQFELAVQAEVTQHGGAGRADERLTWAFASYRFTPNDRVRVGRLSSDMFVLSTYRNVGFAYPLVRPPIEFYGFLPSIFDGLDAMHGWKWGDARWRLGGYVGRERTGDYEGEATLELTRVYGLSLLRESNGLSLHATHSRSKVGNNLKVSEPLLAQLASLTVLPVPSVAGQAAALRHLASTQDVLISYTALGLNFDRDRWVGLAEWSRIGGFHAARYESAYATLGRRLDAFTFYGMAAGVRTRAVADEVLQWDAALAPYVGVPMASAIQQLGVTAQAAIRAAGYGQTTLAVGTRWDVHPKLAIKCQWDHVHTRTDGGSFWSPKGVGSMRANILSLTADFVW